MEHLCQNCGYATQTDTAPRFCSECGSRFGATQTQEAATVPPDTQLVEDMATMVPGPTPGTASHQRDALPGYEITRELGRGGMGVVYEALEAATGRKVALKLLAAGVDGSEEAVQRFLREGKIAASLSHPRSTFVYDAGESEGRFFITMELMTGGTVKDVVDREQKLPVTQAVNYTLDVLEGLEAAHAIDVVHRDVKPPNCFVTANGRVKVGDFGISKSLVSDAELTQTGAFMGTPQYAAPEQIRAAPVDNRTDIYSTAATLFFMLTGRPPFQGDAIQVIADIASEPAPTVESVEPDVPHELSQVIAGAMEKDPARRPQTAGEFRLALLPFSDRASSIGDVGRRMAAFFVDTTLATIVIGLALFLFSILSGTPAMGGDFSVQLSQTIASVSLLICYFGICEWRWGRGAGKLLMGLRVVSNRGESAKLPKALLRAAIVPGVATLARATPPLAYSYVTGKAPDDLAITGESGLLLSTVAFPLTSAVVGLVMLSTMRKRNGYRGLHELATGTRVVRVLPAVSQKKAATVTIPIRDTVNAGTQYEVAGKLCDATGYSVYAATDKGLGRPVWLLKTGAKDHQWSAARMGISRGTRQHILRSHVENENRWDALEAVNGTPLTTNSVTAGAFTWPTIRQALIDLAEELVEATDDGTLPQTLTREQVWLDSAGRVKLLDLAVTPSGSTDTPVDSLSPVQLLVACMNTCKEILPGRGLDSLAELSTKPDTLETLRWAEQQLQRMGDRSGRVTWDERLGMLAVSFGTEYAASQAFLLAIAVLGAHVIGGATLPILLAVLLPAVIGYIFKGGPVFRIAQVTPRRNGVAASPIRCAVRNTLAWITATVGSACLWWYVSQVFGGDNKDLGDQAVFSIVWMGLLGIFAVGSVLTILMPRRGVQDLIAGTELVAD